jgi:hypothetical protein
MSMDEKRTYVPKGTLIENKVQDFTVRCRAHVRQRPCQ